ncbi:MAG: hypothetical protein SGARI_007270 [Bacillariaceae sp.]
MASKQRTLTSWPLLALFVAMSITAAMTFVQAEIVCVQDRPCVLAHAGDASRCEDICYDKPDQPQYPVDSPDVSATATSSQSDNDQRALINSRFVLLSNMFRDQVNATAVDTYRYLNFDELPDFVKSAAKKLDAL